MTEPTTLMLGANAGDLRRRVGPVAWVVLETICATANEADNRLVARSSVRDLAREVGLSRNTAARAVRRLVGAGVLTVEQDRAEHGTFGRSTYRLSLPSNTIATSREPQLITTPTVDARRPRVAPRRAHPVEQLALLSV